ncbi:MAG TPA: haloalkane dehalogenase [Deltaproteobacteria bacterium]|nr:haloalkane dehalogenase [Deltaproteobacteria bacterium]
MTTTPPLSTTPLPKQKIAVLGHEMAYHERGEGDPIVFLHGNPTSSYLWRNIVPHLEEAGRCIVPDLIGMGDSQKLAESGPDAYRFVDHRRFLDELLEKLGVRERVTFVIHDWGSALGFDWANRHRDAVRGIAYMEAIVAPIRSWRNWPKAVQPVFQGFRSDKGEEMVLENNLFIEGMLPNSILRRLSEEEMNEYRRPFRNPGEDRRPTLTWPREIPIEGEPADVTRIVQDYANWLAGAEIPKLLIRADPGAILRGELLETCRAWPNQEEICVKGTHFIQEDSPHEIGQGIADWLGRIDR